MPTPGPLELVIILVIALLILGPGKLPDVGAALGKSIKEFRKASSDVQEAVTVNVDTSPLPPTPAAPAAPAAAVAAAVAAQPAAPAPVAEAAPVATAPTGPTTESTQAVAAPADSSTVAS
jgi:TatA/E family protein of Tat protein translocase